MVLPGDKLESKLTHTGMAGGKMVVTVDTFNQNGVKVSVVVVFFVSLLSSIHSH